jgi:hypothetical protein
MAISARKPSAAGIGRRRKCVRWANPHDFPAGLDWNLTRRTYSTASDTIAREAAVLNPYRLGPTHPIMAKGWDPQPRLTRRTNPLSRNVRSVVVQVPAVQVWQVNSMAKPDSRPGRLVSNQMIGRTAGDIRTRSGPDPAPFGHGCSLG